MPGRIRRHLAKEGFAAEPEAMTVKTMLMSDFLRPGHPLRGKGIPDFGEPLGHGDLRTCTALSLLEVYGGIKTGLLREIEMVRKERSSSSIQESKKYILAFNDEYIGTLSAFKNITFYLGRDHSLQEYIVVIDGNDTITKVYPRGSPHRPARFHLVEDYKDRNVIAVFLGHSLNYIDARQLRSLSRERQIVIKNANLSFERKTDCH